MPDRIEPPQIVQTEDETYAFIHLKIPRSEMHAVLSPTLTELFAEVEAQGMPMVPWFAHHLTLGDGDFDFEACIPVDTSFVPTGRIKRGVWPAMTVVRTVYKGDYLGLPDASEEFNGWIRRHGQPYAGNIYERYVGNRGNTRGPADYRTELSWPLTAPATESEHA